MTQTSDCAVALREAAAQLHKPGFPQHCPHGCRVFAIMYSMCMLDTIHAKRDEVRRLAHRYNGRSVYVFGSCARKEEKPGSDIDFLVDFAPGTTLFGMADLKDSLQALFNRSVDLITEKSLKQDSFGDRVRAERVAI